MHKATTTDKLQFQHLAYEFPKIRDVSDTADRTILVLGLRGRQGDDDMQAAELLSTTSQQVSEIYHYQNLPQISGLCWK